MCILAGHVLGTPGDSVGKNIGNTARNSRILYGPRMNRSLFGDEMNRIASSTVKKTLQNISIDLKTPCGWVNSSRCALDKFLSFDIS